MKFWSTRSGDANLGTLQGRMPLEYGDNELVGRELAIRNVRKNLSLETPDDADVKLMAANGFDLGERRPILERYVDIRVPLPDARTRAGNWESNDEAAVKRNRSRPAAPATPVRSSCSHASTRCRMLPA